MGMTPAATPIDVRTPSGNHLDVIEKRNVSASMIRLIVN